MMKHSLIAIPGKYPASKLLCAAFLLLALSSHSLLQAGDVSVTISNPEYCGWLDQHYLGLPPVSNPGLSVEACAPSSAVNALVFLQNAYPGLFGTNLAGTNQADWSLTASLLATNYLHTQYGQSPTYLNGTTPIENLPLGMSRYFQDLGYDGITVSGVLPQGNPGGVVNFFVGTNLPSTYLHEVPTWGYLEETLRGGSPVILSLLYEGISGGHNVLLTGLTRHPDATGSFTFVDPLDPCNYDSSGLPLSLKFSSGTVAIRPELNLTNGPVVDTLTNVLTLTYDQYQGTLPHTDSYSTAIAYIGGATIFTIPEPSTYALFGLGVLSLLMGIRRTRSL